MKIAWMLVAAAAVGAAASTLTGDKAMVISANEIKSQFDAVVPLAKTAGSAGPTIANFGNLGLMVSVRTANGAGELHQNFDDLMIVKQGTATLVTGGTLVDPKTVSDGEIRGTSVKNGVSKTLAEGDVVVVPAGVPHQLLIPPGTVYESLVAKVKEK
jgi:mannose-6-phosphate isomerase-like protein (cupin superfamily)